MWSLFSSFEAGRSWSSTCDTEQPGWWVWLDERGSVSWGSRWRVLKDTLKTPENALYDRTLEVYVTR